MKAEIIAVGTELLLGQIVNTNAKYLSEQLSSLGINIYFHSVVGDNEARVKDVIGIASQRADLVIFTGGLGPTDDDLTKEVLAAYLKQPLEISETELAKLQISLKKRKIEWLDSLSKMVTFIPGSYILNNELGTAPGMIYTQNNCTYVLLPGPPREMVRMFEGYAIPWLKDNYIPHGTMTLYSHVLKFLGITEGKLEDTLLDLITEQEVPTLATLVQQGEVHLRLTARALNESAFMEIISPVLKEIEGRVGQFIVGRDKESLTENNSKALVHHKLTVSTAESCTGGMLGARLTSIPGSSAYYRGSVIAYQNEIKSKVLSVPQSLLEEKGAVSSEVASAMAEGVSKLTGSSVGIGITGIAGPEGGTPQKPVGLVYVALHSPTHNWCDSFTFHGDRDNVRYSAAKMAEYLLFRYLREISHG